MIRRVVTGHSQGKAVFLEDGAPPRSYVSKATPGSAFSDVWRTGVEADIPPEGPADPVATRVSVLPAAGETRMVVLRIPPQSVAMREDFDPAAAAAEFAEQQPEMAALMEPDSPGMHRTDSVDYVIVLEGEIHLELDDRSEKRLSAQDIVIQNGTRHAWHNRTDRPAVLAVVLVGAKRR